MRRSLVHIVLSGMSLLAIVMTASGCAVVGAFRGSPPPPLEVPAAPPRVVAAYPAEVPEPEVSEITVEEPAEDVPTIEPEVEPIPAPEPATAPVPEPPPDPEPDALADLPELRPAPDEDIDAEAVRRRLRTTAQILARIDRTELDASARAQHDTARRFHNQATAALAAGSVRFSYYLNEKAETLARDLQTR